MTTQHIDWVETLSAEAVVCGLLSKLLFKLPERAWLLSLAEMGVFEDIPLGEAQADTQAALKLLQSWSAQALDAPPEDVYRPVRDDYMRLFVGPDTVLAPPWESVYFNDERLTFQKETLDVRNWYRRYGLEPVEVYKEPDDHIGLELMFLAHLAQAGLQALEDEDRAALEDTLASQRTFLSQHPLRWINWWSENVQQHAHTELYRGVALLAQGALKELAARLNAEA